MTLQGCETSGIAIEVWVNKVDGTMENGVTGGQLEILNMLSCCKGITKLQSMEVEAWGLGGLHKLQGGRRVSAVR